MSLFLFGGYLAFGQEITLDLPKIFPASPEAANLGRFGEVPVNTSVGMAEFSVPIYTIKEYDFDLPISLSYQHNGLVVDQIPGHLGMGWSLDAGGMITRQVRGRPDEGPAGYIGTQMTGLNKVIPYIQNTLPSAERNEMNIMVSEGILDTQPDKFVVNVGNLNATFYFDENKEIFTLPYKPYKIQLIDSNDFEQGFVVTDDYGIEYYFQEIEETKRTWAPVEEAAAALLNGYVSGWKLTEIKLPSSRSIYFYYDNGNNSVIHYQRVKSQTYKQRLTGDCDEPLPLSTKTRDYKITSKLLKEIVFPSGKLQFNNVIAPDSGGGNDDMNKYLSYLSSIELKDNFDQLVSRFDLIFDNTNKTRKLLTEVKLNNDPTRTYQFEYEGTPPDDIPWSQQDFWGYYNNNQDGGFFNSLGVSYQNRASDFTKAVLGSLKKITYPTKGYTEISYEANSVKREGNEIPYECSTAEMNTSETAFAILGSVEQNAGTNYVSDTKFITVEEPYLYAAISIWTRKIDAEGGDIYGDASAEIFQVGSVTEICGSDACSGEDAPYPLLGCQGTSRSLASGPLDNLPKEERYHLNRVKLNPGQYRLFAEVDNEAGLSMTPGDELRAEVTVHFYDANGNPPPTVLNIDVGGTRVSQIKSCPDNDPNNCIIKEYNYLDASGESVGDLFRKRNVLSYELETLEYSKPPPFAEFCTSTWRIHSSASNVPLSYYMGSHVFYNGVEEKTVNNQGESLGFLERSYTFSDNVQQQYDYPFLAKDDKEYMNGHVLSENMYDAQNSVVLESTNQYDFIGLSGLNAKDAYSLSIAPYYIENISFGITFYSSNHTLFSNATAKSWLIGTNQKQWEGISNIETQINRTYSSPQGHLKTEEEEGSNGKTDKMEYFYPYDLATGTYQNLINQNRISKAVQVKSYSENDVMSNTLSEYQWFGNTGILEPGILKNAKGDDSPSDRLVYHRYNNYAQPVELSLFSGAHTVYIWGYNSTLPVAKLENVNYSQISTATINNIQNLSNLDNDNCTGLSGCDEANLRDALNDLRVLFPEAIITTYTYDPLVGPTSMTDSKGYTIYYQYDQHNRLEYVLDSQENLIEKMEYHYKN